MKDFYFVNRVVLPLINSQKRMEAKHDKAMTCLDDANKTLDAKNAEVAEKNAALWEVNTNDNNNNNNNNNDNNNIDYNS